MTGERAGELDRLALRLERLAMLLRAGLSRRLAWSEAQRSVPAPPASRRRSGRDGRDRRRASDEGDELVAALFAVATRAGAPLVPALQAEALALRERAQHAREAEIAATGPRMTAKVLALLPAGGVVLAFALGFDVLAAMTRSSLGIVGAIVGVLLGVGGALWTRRLVAAAVPEPGAPGLILELTSVAVRGGLPAMAAIGLAVECAPAALAHADERRIAEETVRFARRSGAPVAALLVEEAGLRRRRSASEARVSLEKLSVRLLAPLGVCVLPSFLLLGVLPVVSAVISSTVARS